MPRLRASRPDQIVELDRPSLVPTGRLRLVGFPGRPPRQSIKRFELTLQSYPQATAVAIIDPNRSDHNIGAVYDEGLTLVQATQRARPPGPNWSASPPSIDRPKEVRHLPGRTFFAGTHARHFGHILLETLTRFWPSVDYSVYDHFITIPSHGTGASGANNSLIQKLLRSNRIPSSKLVLTRLDQPLRCDVLDVASPPFLFAHSADPRFLDVFDRMGSRVERRRYKSDLSALPRRIYLSRSKLTVRAGSPEKRSADNEPEVEALMSNHGFEVIHPQELPIHKQIALVRNAEIIAGCDGSALHLGVFARPGARMLALDTRRLGNQFLINQARGLDAVHVWAATSEVENRLARWTVDLDRVTAGLELVLPDRS